MSEAGLEIGEASAHEARAIAAVHVASWREAYRGLIADAYLAALSIDEREAMWRECIARGQPHLIVARRAGQVCGFAAFGASRDADAAPGTAELIALYADPAHWSRGVGRELWRELHQRVAAQRYTAVSLWVLAGNARGIRFYEAAGFAVEAASLKSFSLGGQRLEELRLVQVVRPARPESKLP